MRMYDIIKNKRDGKNLTKEEIDFFIEGYTKEEIRDYQASALLMAIYLNGMNEEETLNLTKAMTNSGDIVDLSNINGKKVDKHSTGGVGDTVTLVLGPIVAACGIPFVKTSGRGLGHTGGTVDKLEAIKNFKVDLTNSEFENNINEINIAISSQTGDISPADGKLYALRDVTATVDNLSLIASSIMSKKLSLTSEALVLDVKVGSGAFMRKEQDAIELADAMVKIGKGAGKNTVALVTNMDEPLGNSIGNILEVIEAIDTLKGNGPKDLEEISVAIATEILMLSEKFKSEEEAKKKVNEVISKGLAFEKFIEMVEWQEGDSSYLKDTSLFDKADYIVEVYSDKSGYISGFDTEKVGLAASILGAGRESLESKIDLTAGLILNKKVDDRIEKGELLYTLHTNNKDKIDEVKKILSECIFIDKNLLNNKKKLIIKRID